jgi:hypothetical protein
VHRWLSASCAKRVCRCFLDTTERIDDPNAERLSDQCGLANNVDPIRFPVSDSIFGLFIEKRFDRNTQSVREFE